MVPESSLQQGLCIRDYRYDEEIIQFMRNIWEIFSMCFLTKCATGILLYFLSVLVLTFLSLLKLQPPGLIQHTEPSN